MFNQVSWADYISTLITTTVFYYCFVAARYYRHDIAWWISNRQRTPLQVAVAAHEQHSSALFKDELQAFCREASQQSFERSAILSSISLLLQRYGLHRDPLAKEQLQEL